jgi:DNA polymerase-3 subunit gamma/tau
MLSPHAFNALLKTLEEPPQQTLFIFATTEFQKVPATIVSRCQHFEFKRISQKETVDHLRGIAGKEHISISDYGLTLIADAAEGSMRDAQSLLDQAVAFSGQDVRDDDLKEILGTIGRDLLFGCSSLVFGQDPAAVFPLVEKIMERGHDLRAFYKDLILHFRNLLLVRSVSDVAGLLPANAEELAALKEEAGKVTAEELLRFLHVLQEAEPGLRYSPHPQIYLETLLIKLSQFGKIVPLQELIEEVGRLKGHPPEAHGEGGERLAPPPAPPKSVAASRPASAAPSTVRSSPPEKPPAEAPGSREPRRERSTESALKDPAVRTFMDAFRAQILSVEPATKDKEKEET